MALTDRSDRMALVEAIVAVLLLIAGGLLREWSDVLGLAVGLIAAGIGIDSARRGKHRFRDHKAARRAQPPT